MIRRKILLAALIVAVPVVGLAGDIEKAYEQQEKEAKDNAGQGAQIAKADITEIALERTACFGTCPVYSITLHRDGTVRYHGEEYVDRKGDFAGTIAKEDFERLAAMAIDANFMKFEHRYSNPITDHSTVYTSVSTDKTRKIVSDYANGGPEKLRALEKAISETIGKVKWEERK